MKFNYQHIVIGGTFDVLHEGHKKFISKAFEAGQLVTIGITTDKFNKQRKKNSFENQNLRKKKLNEFLDTKGFSNRYNILFIDDIYGTTISDPTIQSILTTKDTFQNIQKINQKRNAAGLAPLEVIFVEDYLDLSGKKLSSTRIRSGAITTDGLLYKEILFKIADKKFDNAIRDKFKKPFGKLTDIKSALATHPIITVGDETTKNALNIGIIPKISIIDFKVQRIQVYKNLTELGFHSTKPTKIVTNMPGGISYELIETIDKSINKKSKSIILVKGEEDLAVIPAVLLSPLGTKILYGQPNKGVVEIIVSTDIKNQLCNILTM